jgi:hypothetical protein
VYSQNLAVVVARGTHAKKALAFLSRGDNHSNAETKALILIGRLHATSKGMSP